MFCFSFLSFNGLHGCGFIMVGYLCFSLNAALFTGKDEIGSITLHGACAVGAHKIQSLYAT